MTMLELLEESPIIAAIKSWEGLGKKVLNLNEGSICAVWHDL